MQNSEKNNDFYIRALKGLKRLRSEKQVTITVKALLNEEE